MLKFIKKSKILRKIKTKYASQIGYVKNVLGILGETKVTLLAPYISYFILLSFIPIVTLIFEVVFLTINNNSEVLTTLKEILPSHVYTILVGLIGHNPGHISILTITNIILLFVASQIYLSFRMSYLIIYNVPKKPHYIKDHIIALINTLLLIILIFFLSIFTVFNHYLYNIIQYYIIDFSLVGYFYNYINIILSIMIISSVITFMMYSVPELKQKVKDVIQGSLFVTFGWIVVSFGFKIYADRFANYETVYKTFGSIIIFVTWIYLLSFVLILGVIINRAKITTYEKNRKQDTNSEYTEGSEY